jgi:DNA polymerase-3 subunit alpha
MDSFGVDRASLMASLDIALQAAEQHNKSQTVGQVDLFGGTLNVGVSGQDNKYQTVPPWSEEQRLLGEKETLGLYLSGHPIARYESELIKFITARIVDLKPSKDKTVVVAGLVVTLKIMNTKSGNRIAFFSLDDRTARIEAAVFSEAFSKYRELINKDQLLVVEGEVNVDEFTGGHRINCRRILSIDQAREGYAKSLWLKMHKKQMDSSFLAEVKQTLLPFRGGSCPVYISYDNSDASTRIALGPEWSVRPIEKLLQDLSGLCGKDRVVISY